MGGKNHHQCTGCIRHTTILAKTVSLAQARLLEANAVLEDTMVAELYESADHAAHFASQIVPLLEDSKRFLRETIEMVQEVIRLMPEIPYRNERQLKSINADAFRGKLLANGVPITDEKLWNDVASSLLEHPNTEHNFNVFAQKLSGLIDLTDDVIDAIESAKALKKSGHKMVDTFEANRDAFKIRFSRLMITWDQAGLMLGYSALFTTEAHLLAEGHRSLEVAA
jgi:hypothetical protein